MGTNDGNQEGVRACGVRNNALKSGGSALCKSRTNNPPHHDASFRDDLLVESHGIEDNDRPYKDQMHFYIIVWGIVQ